MAFVLTLTLVTCAATCRELYVGAVPMFRVKGEGVDPQAPLPAFPVGAPLDFQLLAYRYGMDSGDALFLFFACIYTSQYHVYTPPCALLHRPFWFFRPSQPAHMPSLYSNNSCLVQDSKARPSAEQVASRLQAMLEIVMAPQPAQEGQRGQQSADP